MKRLFIFLPLFSLSFFACEEIPPVVTGSMGGQVVNPPSEQKRQVLIEEFTGVRCVQCPGGSLIIEDLLAAHGSQLIAVSIHAGTFAPPYPQSQLDFRTPEGDNILNYLGAPFGYPAAVVNRRQFTGQFGRQLGKDQWAGYIEEEKAGDPQVKIEIEPVFDAITRSASIEVQVFVEETISNPNVRLSVMFTEDNIVDHQLTPTSSPGTDPNYKHKHALRGMATPFDGISLTESLIAGTRIEKSFTYTIPATWKEENLNVIAVVSLSDGETKDVLQAHKVDLIN